MTCGLSIMVIDADPAIRKLLERVLKRAGYRVQDVAPGQDTPRHLVGAGFGVVHAR
jgi:CheY-like chemotaxis protein